MKNFPLIVFVVLITFSCENAVEVKSSSDKQSRTNSVNGETKSPTTSNSEDFVITSKITCPKCGYSVEEQMPTEVCQISYTCKKCKATLHPEGDDCCVFCTYGDHKCPSKQ